MKRHLFWTMGYPYGVAALHAPPQLIDVDEAGFTLERADSKYSKAYMLRRVRSAGNYGHSEKVTLILGVTSGCLGGGDGRG